MEPCSWKGWSRILWVFVLNFSGFVSVEGSGRCSLFSRQHIHTFDGVIYEFPGDCSYMLAGDCQHRSFSILGDFSHGKRKGVTLFLGEFFELHLSVHGMLSQGAERIPLPYASSSVFVGFELGYVRLWSEEFGFSIRIDPSHNIQLTLGKHHSNRTCGLCGNYNYLVEDDYTAQEGFLTDDPYDFANSWAMKGADEPCKRVLPPSQSCNSTGESAKDQMSRCEAMSSSALYLRCAHLVDAAAFVSVCESDACHCRTGDECVCQAMLEYARTCANHGVTLSNWHVQSQCSPKCPVGMEYSVCTPTCSTSCQSVNIQEVCNEECVDGCNCPAGKVLDGDRCVDVSQCSCTHAGRSYPPGSSISQDCNTCVCRHGSWECTNEGCPGGCLVTGQSHYKTFDDKFFTFSGICQYLLAKDCQSNSFSAIVETAQCADDQDAVCTRSVTLRFRDLANQTVHLKHGGVVSVDGMDVKTPLINGPLRVQNTVLSSVRLRYGDDLHLDWDGRGRVLLKLNPAYAGKTCGLCGNYNGNQGDDFLTVGGLVETRVEGFGNAWKMNADCDDLQLQHSDPCILNPKRVRFAEEACAVLLSVKFEPCHDVVSPEPYVTNCRYDVCSCADGQECLCDAVRSYAAACAAKGVLINWRGHGYCELTCPDDQVYEVCGNVCNQTCRSLSLPDSDCGGFCEEGCFCPRGLFLSDAGECVPPEHCSCHHNGEIFEPNDMIGDHHAICVCESGSMQCTSNEATGSTLTDLFFDDHSSSRGRRSISCPPPLQRFECESARDAGIECAKTCQNLELECVSQGCVSGCMCPPGTVRHRRECIPQDQCPCYHNNRPYASGQSINVDCNTCVCEKRQWKCTQRVCDGVCRVIGETNYISFDGLKFSFPGPCQYVLAQDYCNGLDGTFRVLVENSACGIAGYRCSKSITVMYMGGLIVMEHGEVRMKRPVLKETVVEIVRSGQYYIILLGKHISITWDTGTRISLQINGQYRGKVCGLCGNFDGSQNNDLLSSSNQMEVGAADFGNSWKVRPSCADAVPVVSQCSTDMVKLVTVEQSCRVLTSAIFRECNVVVDPEPYWDICTHDTCSCPSVGDCACFCNTIAAYAHECAQKGLLVNWRSNDLCPLSCEELNKDAGVECEWRYNACGSACPPTCQHPEPLSCPITCVEGCHAVCPPGQVLDEVLRKCVEPSQCQVCVHNGERISHGKQFIINHEDPHLCQICHCESNTLTCGPCPATGLASTLAPTTVSNTPTPLPFSTPVPADACDRAMDLAFLVDGSSALSEDDFSLIKLFILRVVERFRMGSAHTRATVLLFHSGVKSYDMQVQKWIFKKMVRELRYSGGDVAFMDEAIKYLAVYIYDKNKREHAGRVAILLTASSNPRPMRSTQRLLRKKDITIVTVALGPDVNMAQVNEITKATPSSRSYIVSSVAELDDEALAITDYLCTLGLEPEPPKKPPTRKPSTTSVTPTTTTTSKLTAATVPPTAAIVTSFPSIPSPGMTFPPPTVTTYEVVFLLESSNAVGEEGFNETRDALVDVIASLDQKEVENLRITVMQYSLTVTVVISRMELQHREQVLQRMRQLRWTKGAEVNTGHAIRSVYETVTTDTPSNTPDQMVFLITQSPPTDVIQRPTSSTHKKVYPIGVGRQIRYEDLAQLSFPDEPIMLDNPSDLKILRPMLINISKTIRRPLLPTLPPRATLPPSVPCSKPMDVLFLLRASSDNQFEDLKIFVRTIIKSTNIGRNHTQVAVIVYGGKSAVAVTWRDEQTEDNLLKLLETLHSKTDNTTRLGAALRLAVQTAISSTSGGRMGIPKAVVMVVTDRSIDSVQEAANEALTAGVSVFPIGLGNQYDQTELSTLAGPHAQDNIIRLSSTEYLLAMAALDQSFTDKLCRAGPPGVCVDDEGNERKPGETWLLSDGCHSVLCNPSGTVTVQSHRINCEKMEPPVCKNSLPALRYNHTCGCTWTCPCSCMGSSTSHVVSFSGAALKLRAACSYLLLRSGGAELVLHAAACQSSPNQICMKSLELKEGGTSVVLQDDMKVTVGGVFTAVPFRIQGVTVTQIGAILHQLRSEQHGFTLTFTPHSNEFMINMDISMKPNTTGVCGSCSDEQTGLVLSDGSVTTDPDVYLKGWALGECVQHLEVESCAAGVAKGCDVLSSEVFSRCHALVPLQDYVQICQRVACQPNAVCDLVTAYSTVCRQQGVCVDWRTPTLCPMSCSGSMEYDACRTGCLEQCGQSQFSPGDMMGDGLMKGNGSLCLNTPTEGCFCPEGSVLMGDKCVGKEACSQCMDHHGKAHQFMESWNPEDNPCLLCVCLDQQRINCTALPCSNAKALECGQCEVLQEKMGSKCCPEYECVCDANCKRSDPPLCDHGLSVVLTNPGDCLPIYKCVCKKDQCPVSTKPSCPAYKKLSVKPSECCDSYGCVCDCQNITRTCPPGYITNTNTNDCGCIEVTCTPDKVCVVDAVVYQVGSRWDEKCKTCTCTEQTDRQTGLHIAQCVDPVCNQICPLGTTYSHSESECCGHCRKSSCVEGGYLRQVGEQWVSPHDRCVWSECAQVNEEVFIQHTNTSCHLMDTPTCPLGTELQCNTVDDCCPTCHCVPMNACVVNQTVIAAGERVMLDVCTHCECVGDKRSYRLSCRKMSCSPCSEGYTLEPIPNACCGRCVATACSIRRPDGQLVTLKANTTRTDGCIKHKCSVNKDEELVLETLVTTCPPFDRKRCLEHGGKISQIEDTCCEMCTEPECRRTVGLLNYIRVDDCQSEEKIELTYCEGKCSSKSVYSLDKHKVESECVCCSATGTVPMNVSLHCANGTRTHHQVLAVTGCDCMSHACPTD
ncbi:von Willebrand factor [Rhinichthys klamathensis goyatoka]|uniref:von Willebrand factor n=1 Tax=Rhinichthys klamathensis goyatoka TaxID=3034132 RepID=UPI0024B532BF|nr:von Willebrand factor [Rhinichthys klamathensis goyatoka]XP_056092013.1 von Willebrand factor [Rhinichthys klamathensis goyatoka]